MRERSILARAVPRARPGGEVGLRAVISGCRMTEETRKEILKLVKAEGEAARVAIRNARKDGMSLIKQEPSEDDRKRLEKQVSVIAVYHGFAR